MSDQWPVWIKRMDPITLLRENDSGSLVYAADVDALQERLATAEAERLTLARALLESAPAALDGDPDAYFERRDAANDLAARIVAEADAAKAYLCTRCGAHVPENVPCSSCPAETDAEVRR